MGKGKQSTSPLVSLFLAGFVACLGLGAWGPCETHSYFEIRALDAETGAPVPGVTLTTTNQITLRTDRNGRAAFYEPGFMGKSIFFHAARTGFEGPPAGFSYHGKAFVVDEGGVGTIPMRQTGAVSDDPSI